MTALYIMDQVIANQQYKYIVHFGGKWIAYDGTKFVCSADANVDAVAAINELSHLSSRLLSKIVAANTRVVDIGSAVYTYDSDVDCVEEECDDEEEYEVEEECDDEGKRYAEDKHIIKASIEDKIYSFLKDYNTFRYPDYIETVFVNYNTPTADEVMRDYVDAVAGKSIDIYVIWMQLRNNIDLLKKIIAVFRMLVSLGRFAIDVIIDCVDCESNEIKVIIIDDAACVFHVRKTDEKWDTITVRNEIAAFINDKPCTGSYRKIKMIRAVIEKCSRTLEIYWYDNRVKPRPFQPYAVDDFIVDCGYFRYTKKFKIIGEDDEYQRIVHDAMRSAFNNVVKNAYGIIKARVAAVMDDLAANDN